MTAKIEAFKENDSWGVRERYIDAFKGCTPTACIYDAMFTERAAKRIAELEAQKKPPKDWHATHAILRRDGMCDADIFSEDELRANPVKSMSKKKKSQAKAAPIAVPVIKDRTIFLRAIPSNKSTQGIVIRKTHKNRGFLLVTPDGRVLDTSVSISSYMPVNLCWFYKELSAAALGQLAKAGVITRDEIKWLRDTAKARAIAERKEFIEGQLVAAARGLKRHGVSQSAAVKMLRQGFE